MEIGTGSMTETEMAGEVEAGAGALAAVPLLVEIILLAVTTVGLLLTPETDLHHVDGITRHPDVVVGFLMTIGGLDLTGQTSVIHDRSVRAYYSCRWNDVDVLSLSVLLSQTPFSIMAATRSLTAVT